MGLYKISGLVILIILSINVFGQTTASEWLDDGYSLYEDEAYDEAIISFKKAAELDSTNAEIFYLLGVCQSLQGNDEDALSNYSKALRINPEYAEVYYEIGYSYFLNGKTEKALKAFDQAIRFRPDYAEAYVNRGSLKCIAGDSAGAQEDWETARKYGASVPQSGCN